MLRKLKMTNFRRNVSRPGIIDARVRYRAVARRFRNTILDDKATVPDAAIKIMRIK